MYYFLESFFIFVRFNVLILCFGSLLLHQISRVFPKKNHSTPSFLLRLLKGHAVGLALYIILSYFFILVWEFNLFTGYYFYLIITIFFFCVSLGNFFFHTENGQIREKIKIKFKKSLQYINHNRFTILFLIISSAIFIYFLYFKIGDRFILSSSHYAVDGYFWEGETFFLLKYNTINFGYLRQYPGGFPLYLAGMLLPQSGISIKEIHYFIKFVPLFIFILNLLLCTLLGLFVFRKRIYALLAAFSLFSYKYFMYRSLMALPTILCTTFLIYLFIFECQTESTHNLSWVLIGSLFLIHPIQFLLIFSCYSIYIVINSLLGRRTNTEKKEEDKRIVFRLVETINSHFVGILLFIGSVIIYSLIGGKQNYDWINIYRNHFGLKIFPSIDFLSDFYALFPSINSFFDNFLLNFPFLVEIIGQTSRSLFLFFCLVLILPLGINQNRKNKKLLILLKAFCGIWILMFLSKDLFSSVVPPESYLDSLFQGHMFNVYVLRISEVVALPMVFLIVYGIQEIVKLSESMLKRAKTFLFFRMDSIIYRVKLKWKKFWKISPFYQKKRFHLIPFCINVAFLLLFLNINLNTFILQEYRISGDHTNYTFKLRESEENFFQNYGEYATIHYSDASSVDQILMRRLFAFDHTVQTFDEEMPDVAFLDFIQNLTSGDIVILSRPTSKYFYIKYHVNSTSFAKAFYENNMVLILRVF